MVHYRQLSRHAIHNIVFHHLFIVYVSLEFVASVNTEINNNIILREVCRREAKRKSCLIERYILFFLNVFNSSMIFKNMLKLHNRFRHKLRCTDVVWCEAFADKMPLSSRVRDTAGLSFLSPHVNNINVDRRDSLCRNNA